MFQGNQVSPRLFYSIAEFRSLTSLSKTRIFEELKAGRLIGKKCGRRTLLPVSEVEAWIASLEGRKVG